MSQRKPQPIHPFINFIVSQVQKITDAYYGEYYLSSIRGVKALMLWLKSVDREANPQIIEKIDEALERVKMVSGFNWNQTYSRKLQLSRSFESLATSLIEALSEILYQGQYLLPETWGVQPTAENNVSGQEVMDPIPRTLSSRIE